MPSDLHTHTMHAPSAHSLIIYTYLHTPTYINIFLSRKVERSKCLLEVLCKPSGIAVIFYSGSFSLFPLNMALKFGVCENI